MSHATRLLLNDAVLLAIFLLAVDPVLAQGSNSGEVSAQQREAMQQAQSSDAMDQQYQIDQQLLQLDRQKLRDGKAQGADAQTLHALQQTVDAAQAKLNTDFDRVSNLHQSSQFMQQEVLGYHLLHAADRRKRLQQEQAQRLAQEKEHKETLREREAQKLQQQALLVQQQQLLIAQQQNLLAAEQQNQNQTYLNGGYLYSDFSGWPMDAPGWWRRRGHPRISSGKKPLPNRPSAR